MAAIPSHRVQSIYSSFSPRSTTSSMSLAGSYARTPNEPVSTPRSRAAGLSVLSARTASASSSAPAERQYTSSTRRPPPPPPQRRNAMIMEDDPFADGPVVPVASAPDTLYSSPSLITSRTRVIVHIDPGKTIGSASASPPPYVPSAVRGRREARGRLVANVLLSRGSGRPLRKRFSSSGEGRTYIRSGLSRMVAVEA